LALAVDGYALISFLQKKYNLHSNDLAQFYRIAEYYLNVFRKNSVKLWVVFDGLSPSDKTKEKYRRRQKSWNRVMGILDGSLNFESEEDPSSAFLYEYLIIQMLNRLKIQVIRAQGEADPYIAHICQKENFYGVLSHDTDFIIFGVRLLDSETLCIEQENLTVDVYEAEKCAQILGIQKERLSYLACLMGNDFVPRNELENVYNKLKLNAPTDEDTRFGFGAINALARFVNRDDVDPTLQRWLRSSTYDKFEQYRSFYSLPPCTNVPHEDAWNIFSLKELCRYFEDTPWLCDSFKHGLFPVALLHIGCCNEYWLPIVIADVDAENSPYDVTEKLRRRIYKLIGETFADTSESPHKINTPKSPQSNNPYASLDSWENETHEEERDPKQVTIAEVVGFCKRQKITVGIAKRRRIKKDMAQFSRCMSTTENFADSVASVHESRTVQFASFALRYIVEQKGTFDQTKSVISVKEFDAFLIHILMLSPPPAASKVPLMTM
jgi:hypothetical protein